MTILTPTFAQQQLQTNGAAGAPMHVTPAHEPTREGEKPPMAMAVGNAPAAPTTNAQPGPLKVALIGTAPSSRMLAPYNDPSWTIWACSPGNMNICPKVDCWFELHSNLLWPEHESYGKPYIEWLKAQPFPVYMQDNSLVDRAMAFPRDLLVQEFGDDFFTSSFAWMMALAIHMGAAEIALYGIDMASRDEYIRQRPGFYYFRQRARERGIIVSAPHESDIMQSPPLYAYVDSTPFGRKILARRAEVSGRINGMVQQRDQLSNNVTYLQGALEDIDYIESIWSGVTNDMARVQFQCRQLQAENEALKAKIAQLMMPAPMEFAPMTATINLAPEAPAPAKRGRRRKLAEPLPESP